MKKLFLLTTLALGLGCGHVQELETQVAGLQEDNASLTKDVRLSCAMFLESYYWGIAYLGDKQFLNMMSGETIDYPEMDDDCRAALDEYKSLLETREAP